MGYRNEHPPLLRDCDFETWRAAAIAYHWEALTILCDLYPDDVPVATLGLNNHIAHILLRRGVKTVGAVKLLMDSGEIGLLKGMGARRIAEIEAALARLEGVES